MRNQKKPISVNDHESQVHILLFDVIEWAPTPPVANLQDMHRHEFNEVLFVLSGGGTHNIELQSFPLLSQHIHVIPAGYIHAMQREIGSAGFSFSFSNVFLSDTQTHQLLANISDQGHAPVVAIPDSIWAEVLILVQQIKHEFHTKETDFLSVIRHLLSTLLLKIKRCQTTLQVKEKQQLPEKLKAFREILSEQGHQKTQVAQIAAQLFISPNYLNELCRSYYGQTAHEIINAQVLAEAQRLLLHSALNVNEIADHLGFESVAYFSRFFKRLTQKSPLAYRKMNQNSA